MILQARFTSILCGAGALLALAASPGAAQTLYGVAAAPGASSVRAIDPIGGSSSAVVALGLDAVVVATVCASASGGQLYAAGRLAGANRLATVLPGGPSVSSVPLDRAFANLHARSDGRLVGFSSNAGLWEIRRLEPATGVSTLLGAVPALARIVPSASAHDGADRLYQIGRAVADPATPRLYVCHALTGAVLSSVALTREFHSLEVRQDGALLGLGWTGTAEAIHSIDPVTGATAVLQTFPVFGLLPPAASAIDRPAGRVYQVGHAATPASVARLYGRAATSGGGFTSDAALGGPYLALVHAGGAAVSVDDVPGGHVLALSAPKPNPFRGGTRIPFSLDRTTNVTLDVLDVAGRVVATLVDGTREAGAHSAHWQGMDDRGRPLSAGLYLARMRTGAGDRTQRLILLQ